MALCACCVSEHVYCLVRLFSVHSGVVHAFASKLGRCAMLNDSCFKSHDQRLRIRTFERVSLDAYGKLGLRMVVFLPRLPELVFFENNVFLVLKMNSQGVDSFGECVFIFCGLRVWQGVKYFVRILTYVV